MNDKKIKAVSDPLGLRWAAIGMVFLANPLINIIDVIPDFIGLLMIMHGLSKIVDSTGHIREARRLFAVLAMLSALQLCFCAALPLGSDNFKLLLSFSFAVVEAIAFIPAMNHMFYALEYAEMRGADGENDNNGKKSASAGKVHVLGIVFYAVRALGSVLPVVPVLLLYDYRGYVDSSSVDWTEFTNVYYVLSWIVVLCVGIPWLVSVIRYINSFVKQKKLCSRLYGTYEREILSDGGRLAAMRMKPVMMLGIISAALCFDVYFDQLNFVPDFLAAAFLIAAFAGLAKYGGRAKCVSGIVLSVLWGASSVLIEIFELRFKSYNYTAASVAHGIGAAGELYAPIEAATLAEAAFGAAAIILFLITLVKTVVSHVPMAAQLDKTKNHSDTEKQLSDAIRKAVTPALVFAAMYSAASAVYAVVYPYAPASWIIKGVLAILLAATLSRSYHLACDEVYTRLENKL